MMDCTRAETLMNDYVDGTLPNSEASELAEHLNRCAACRESEAELQRLLVEASALPRELEPARDLWPAVKARIEGRAAQADRTDHPIPFLRLAAAAVALVVVTSAATYWLVGRRTVPPPAVGVRPAPALASLKASEPDYLKARKALLASLKEQRSRLSPETVKVIDENLAVMDRALRNMKKALDKDPENKGLALLIEDTYRQEIALLMQAKSLPSNA
jgi:anti-sigma-K factor RskA